jgi:hypothetical protein
VSTTARNIRIDDELWSAAGERAKAEGTNNSELIRQWLEDYAAGPRGGGDALAYRPKPTLDDQIGEILQRFVEIREHIRKLTGTRGDDGATLLEPGRKVAVPRGKISLGDTSIHTDTTKVAK